MTLAEITVLLDQLATAGVFFLTIPPRGAKSEAPGSSGGEIFLHPTSLFELTLQRAGPDAEGAPH